MGRSGTVRLTDSDGDGVVDAIASGPGAFTLWRNGGADGWSAPDRARSTIADGPGGRSTSPTPHVHLADMNGDGLADLVRVRSGRVEYWPGLGDGRFGARVVMAGSPTLRGRRGRSRERPARSTSTATAAPTSSQSPPTASSVTMNRNGRAFAAAGALSPPSRRRFPGTLRAVNMNGGAGRGLLWSSLQLRPHGVRAGRVLARPRRPTC